MYTKINFKNYIWFIYLNKCCMKNAKKRCHVHTKVPAKSLELKQNSAEKTKKKVGNKKPKQYRTGNNLFCRCGYKRANWKNIKHKQEWEKSRCLHSIVVNRICFQLCPLGSGLTWKSFFLFFSHFPIRYFFSQLKVKVLEIPSFLNRVGLFFF